MSKEMFIQLTPGKLTGLRQITDAEGQAPARQAATTGAY